MTSRLACYVCGRDSGKCSCLAPAGFPAGPNYPPGSQILYGRVLSPTGRTLDRFRNYERSKPNDVDEDREELLRRGVPVEALCDDVMHVSDEVPAVPSRTTGEFCCPGCFLIKRAHLRGDGEMCVDCGDRPPRAYQPKESVITALRTLCSRCVTVYIPSGSLLCEPCRLERDPIQRAA